MTHHISVLEKEILSFFADTPMQFFADGTLGAAGHSFAFLQEHPELERVFGFDRDPRALTLAKEKLEPHEKKMVYFHANFDEIDALLPDGLLLDGALLDLGVSSMQIDEGEKGFSFQKEGPLDMRMDPTQRLSAIEVVNRFSEKKLGEIFKTLGEEPRWRQAAKAICTARGKKRIVTTKDLVGILEPVLKRRRNINPMTLVFQALRIYVNQELEHIERAIPLLISRLKFGGKLGIISFHSLEDRIVKNQFRQFSLEKKGKVLTKKPIEATLKEKKENPRSRSAKLRFFERLDL